MPRPPASYQAVIPMAFSPATNLRTFAIHCSVSGSGIFAATKATPPAPRTTPVGVPPASFSILPPRGSGVAASIPAALSAALLR